MRYAVVIEKAENNYSHTYRIFRDVSLPVQRLKKRSTCSEKR